MFRKPPPGENLADAIPHNPAPIQRYRCYADDCPMAGTIFEGSPDGPGVCPFHYGAPPLDVRRITQTLLDWRCVADAIRQARRALLGTNATNGPLHAQTMADAWADLRAAVAPSYWPDLEPGPLRVRDRTKPEGWRVLNVREDLGDWARRLERFLGARVLEARSVGARQPSATPPTKNEARPC